MLSCAASAPKFCSAAHPGKTKPGGIVPQRIDCSRKRGVSSYARHSCWQSSINDWRQRTCRDSSRRSKTSRASVLHTPLERLATGSDCHSEIRLHVARLASLKCDLVHAKRHCLDLLQISASRRDSGELRCDGVPKAGGHSRCLHHQPRR